MFPKVKHIVVVVRMTLRSIVETVRSRPLVPVFILFATVLAVIVGILYAPAVGPVVGAILAVVLTYVVQQESRMRESNRELMDQVVGPSYAEVRRISEILRATKKEAKEIAVDTPFLNSLASSWRYYALDPELRAELEIFRSSISILDQQKTLAKEAASTIIIQSASKAFSKPNCNRLNLWFSRRSSTVLFGRHYGRTPSLELAVDCDPLKPPVGHQAYSLQLLDMNGVEVLEVILSESSNQQTNLDAFRDFWETAKKTASGEKAIVEFREILSELSVRSENLSRKLDLQIKRLGWVSSEVGLAYDCGSVGESA